MDNKGQSGGLITALVFGVASLVIGVIIAFVIISTMTSSDLLGTDRDTMTVVNESAWVNWTGYPLDPAGNRNFADSSVTVTAIYNSSLGLDSTSNFTSLAVANYTINSSGWIINGSDDKYPTVLISYTFSNLTDQEMSAEDLSLNFTDGINNVSGKIPTVLLIGAIVLILGALAILVGVWSRMRMSSGGDL